MTPIRGSPAFRVSKKTKVVKKAPKVWNKTQFGTLQERIKVLQDRFFALQAAVPTLESSLLERRWKLALDEELHKEEDFWRLKSHKVWLTTHDLNTKHFHLSTLIRHRRNAIELLKTTRVLGFLTEML